MSKINLNVLPNHIIKHMIKPYIYCKCSCCNKEVVNNDITTNIYMKEYKTIFDDDFYVYYHDMEYYEKICNECYVNKLNHNMFPIKKGT